ncbi:hypothetical protein OESDEN_02987 [Oesophagostomum dentatum]|uniref:Uncharacterized protein n=1 Tax=Oesophagostomum dentatum TaxID=61180 RepID=A0A0B1TLS6_OESDE|nr:hypothetical protein OESDEN_02987 [Oesophagostomum dentatum]
MTARFSQLTLLLCFLFCIINGQIISHTCTLQLFV